MPIPKRTLTKWRKEALQRIAELPERPLEGTISSAIEHSQVKVINDRILLMTQELIDQYLLKAGI